MAFTPAMDLTTVQNIIMADEKTLTLMDLAGPAMDRKVNAYIADFPGTDPEIAKRIIRAESIIKRSRWDDLATSEKRLCIYFVPDRRARNTAFMQSVIEIDVHVPYVEDYKAWQIQERVKLLLHKKRVNQRYTLFDGQLGELPTMQGFFCCGSRFVFNRVI